MTSMVFLLATFLAIISAILAQNNSVTTHVLLSNTTIVCQSTDIDALQRDNVQLKETLIQMWTSLTAQLNALEARLSCVSNCSKPAVTNSTVIPPVSKLQEKIYQNLTVQKNWTLVYDEPYSQLTTTAELLNVTNTCSNQVVVGARRNTTDPQLTLAAVGPTEVLKHQTALNTPVKFGDVYWYSTPKKSFGFSPSNIIDQGSADRSNSTSELRLSWHLDETSGGYRVGAVKDLNADKVWRKVIYCLN